jgi:hypothetical protein
VISREFTADVEALLLGGEHSSASSELVPVRKKYRRRAPISDKFEENLNANISPLLLAVSLRGLA